MKRMIRQITALCILGTLALSLVGCAGNMQKTEPVKGGLLPPSTDIGDYEPSMDLECSSDAMPIDQAVMTLYFAESIREDFRPGGGTGWYVIYVTNQKGGLQTDTLNDAEKEGYRPPLTDYQSVDGYYIVAEYKGEERAKLTAKWRAFRPMKYNYHEQIVIPEECLVGESGTLRFCAYYVYEEYDEATGQNVYVMGYYGSRHLGNVQYKVEDGKVTFDLGDCKKS